MSREGSEGSASILERGPGRFVLIKELPRGPGEPRKQKWKTYRTRRLVKEALTEFLASCQAGTYVVEHDQTFDGYMQEWLDASASRVRPSTLDSYRCNVA